jgi:protein SCO1/2
MICMRASLSRSLVLAVSLLAANCGPRDGATRYPLKGKVEALDIFDRELTVAHEEIPGFMPALTMPFKMPEDKSLLARFRGMRIERLRRGDVITATLAVTAN